MEFHVTILIHHFAYRLSQTVKINKKFYYSLNASNLKIAIIYRMSNEKLSVQAILKFENLFQPLQDFHW